MKKLSILACILLCAMASLSAQDYYTSKDFDVKLSDPSPAVSAYSPLYLKNIEHVVSFKRRNNGSFIIQSFDQNSLNELSRYESQFEDKYAEFEFFIVMDNRFYIFYSLWDKPNETENLFVLEIDPQTSKFKEKPRSLLSIKGKVEGDLTSGLRFRIINKFNFKFSKSRNNLLIHYRMKEFVSDNNINYRRVGLHAFDGDLNNIWGDIRQMRHPARDMWIVSYRIDNDGNVFALSKIYKDDRSKNKSNLEEIKYKYELMKLSGSNDPAVYTELELDDNKFLVNAVLLEQDDSHLVITGYYKNGYTDAIRGAFVFNFDKNTNSFTKNYHEIPLDIINAYKSEKTVTKNIENEDDPKKGGIKFLSVDGSKIDTLGNITILGEQSWVLEVEQTTPPPPGYKKDPYNPKTNNLYFYSDVFITKITSTGELAWMKRIPKRQQGARDPGGMSYSAMFTDHHLYILYIDNLRNNNLAIGEKPTKHIDGKGGFLTSSKINLETGEVSKENLFDLRNVNGMKVYQFATRRVVNLSEREIAVEVHKKQKEDIWIKVGLN